MNESLLQKELIEARLAISGGLGVPEGELPAIIEAVLNGLRFQRDEARREIDNLKNQLHRRVAEIAALQQQLRNQREDACTSIFLRKG